MNNFFNKKMNNFISKHSLCSNIGDIYYFIRPIIHDTVDPITHTNA